MQLRQFYHLARDVPARPAFGNRDAIETTLALLQPRNYVEGRDGRREVILAGFQRRAFACALQVKLQWPLVLDDAFREQLVDDPRWGRAFGNLDVLAAPGVTDGFAEIGVNPRSGCRAGQHDERQDEK